jgi:hypothetical protein
MYTVGLTGSIDFNINYNGAGNDTNITYSVAPGCESILSVNANTGVVTPLAVGVGVVLVKNASNATVQRLAVSVLPAAEYTIRQQLASGTVTLAAGIAAANGQ